LAFCGVGGQKGVMTADGGHLPPRHRLCVVLAAIERGVARPVPSRKAGHQHNQKQQLQQPSWPLRRHPHDRSKGQSCSSLHADPGAAQFELKNKVPLSVVDAIALR